MNPLRGFIKAFNKIESVKNLLGHCSFKVMTLLRLLFRSSNVSGFSPKNEMLPRMSRDHFYGAFLLTHHNMLLNFVFSMGRYPAPTTTNFQVKLQKSNGVDNAAKRELAS